MSNIACFEKLKNLINVAEEHRSNIGIHPDLLAKEVANPAAPTNEEKKITKEKFFGRLFNLKACRFRYQKLKE
eukprot:3001755-Ditylum_brightwellii.AAC.1